MYEGTNLVSIEATAENKYVNAVMKVLFTEEELSTSLIIETKSRSTKKPLDLEKVKLLKGLF